MERKWQVAQNQGRAPVLNHLNDLNHQNAHQELLPVPSLLSEEPEAVTAPSLLSIEPKAATVPRKHLSNT